MLGRGGFGIVVRAFDETLHRMVAIKVLAPQLAATSPARKRFLREARASARVRHENVVQIHAVEEQPLPYLVMEYIPGQTLQQRLDQTGPLDVPDVLRIGGQIARGLAAAHEQGLIHRDIKPGNILLESGIEQNVKITDFGLARAADDASLTQSGVIAGTPLYMAPEQAKGEPLDHRADLFSLGSVLYTMVSGRPPFRAATTLAVLKRVAEDTPRPIREIIPEVPQWLCDLIARLHAKDPAERFQSAAEVAALLEQHLAHLQQPSLVARPRDRESSAAARAAPGGGPGCGGCRARRSSARRSPTPSGVLPGRRRSPPGRPAPVKRRRASRDARGRTGRAARDRASAHPRAPGADRRARRADRLRRAGALASAPSARDNAVRRADQCNAFLVRFDLAKLEAAAEGPRREGDGELLRVGPEQQRQDEGVRLPAEDGVGRGRR